MTRPENPSGRITFAERWGADLYGDPCTGCGFTAYVCHVVDNLRIWAEGLAAAAVQLSGEVDVPGYDPDLLAEARRYHLVAPEAALWSLDQAATAWSESVTAALDRRAVLHHAARGVQRAEDVSRNNVHDAFHHAWDIERVLAARNHRKNENR